MQLKDQAAIVTGGASGLGAATARKLAAQGAKVAVCDLNAKLAEAVAAEIGGVAVVCDVADAASAEAAVTAAAKAHGPARVLVNCAGIAEPPGSSILDITPAQFEELLDAHLGTVFATCRAAAPKMVAQGGGSIVNTSSFAFLGDYGGTGYPAGKGAVNSLTLAIAAELKERGVRANVVCPGARTRLSTGPDYVAHITDLHRRGLLDEVSMQGSLDVAAPDYAAPTYLYLASDLAKQLTGEIFVASGGFVGRFPRPTPALIGYRDHHDSPPWSVAELSALIDGGVA